jgi:hypothetical protein
MGIVVILFNHDPESLINKPEPSTAPVFGDAPVQVAFYASPFGSGNTCSRSSPCSLEAARDKVRAENTNMSGDIIVYLHGGTYELSSTFELTSRDSGTNGYDVVYKAYEGETPVLSGGKEVSGWSLYDVSNNVYRVEVEPTLQTRQLYVDGVRATRARSMVEPSDFTKTSTGYTSTNKEMQDRENTGDIEIASISDWKNFRCGVSSVSGTTITMKQPCWDNSNRSDEEQQNIGLPVWIENAYELLDEPGEWYLDRPTGYLYYKPRPGEDMSTASTIVPVLETLVRGTGTLDEPIQHIRFHGITFSYATWLRPNSNEGYAAIQAGFSTVGSDAQREEKPPGNVEFSAARSIVFERNVFERLGSVGLSFERGSQDNIVIGNVFTDISGGGVYLGNIEDHHPDDGRAVVQNNLVRDNYITRIGAEYLDQVGIWAGYTDGSVIDHNELYDLPYSGISVGWGWGAVDPDGEDGYTEPTAARNNKIRYNFVHEHLKTLRDGGGIYTLGSQPESTISNNYLLYQLNDHGALYLDEGTQNYRVYDNVISSAPKWLFIWSNSIKNNRVQNNYSDTPSMKNDGTDNIVRYNEVVEDQDWPEPALAIMEEAGITAPYQDIKKGV